jgi:4'-phosphopantetheinyl transferase
MGARLVVISSFECTPPAGLNRSALMSRIVKVEVRECGNPRPECVVPNLLSDVVHIWTRPLQVSNDVEGISYELLSAEERQRTARYRMGRPRTEFILTRGTLRPLTASYLAIAPRDLFFRYAEHAKPLIDGPFDLRSNVSHTEGLALLAFVKTRAIGVDVEKIDAAPDARKLAERFFSVRERDDLESPSADELHAAFFRCWTRKEGYVKARGEGLSLPLHQSDVSVAPDESHALLATRPNPSEAGRWILRDLTMNSGYDAALGSRETDCRLKRWPPIIDIWVQLE